jgi:hypothetical protein
MNIDSDYDNRERWIDDLLRQAATDDSQAPPDSLRASFSAAVARQRRQRQRLAYGLAAAASFLIAAGWTVLHPQRDIRGDKHRVAALIHQSTPPAALSPPVASNRATFVSNGDAIAMPLESSSPDVTIVQVYPTTDTEQRWQRELTLSSISVESTGG